MQVRLGPGPVFAYEWLLTSRRWQMYAARSLFLSGLLLALYFVYQGQVQGRPRVNDLAAYARVGQEFALMILGAQLGLVLLIAPAFTAGAICTQKAQGALLHLLVTDLTNREIILGKLAARLIPLFGLVGSSLPVLFLTSLFGGVEPRSVMGAFMVTLAVVVFTSTLTLVISVWANRVYEVVIASYLVLGLLLFAHPVWHAISWYWNIGNPNLLRNLRLNPFPIAFAPLTGMSQPSLFAPGVYLIGALASSAGLVALAIMSVRFFAVRQLVKPARSVEWRRRLPTLRRLKDLLPAPSLDEHPVAWREWRGNRTALWARIIWFIYAVLSLILLVRALDWISDVHGGWWVSFDRHWTERFAMIVTGQSEPNRFLALQVGALTGIGLFLVSLTSATSLAEERARGSLDMLLVTPLPSALIIRDKWRSAYRVVLCLTVPALLLVAGQLSIEGNWLGTLCFAISVLAYGAALISLALGLATWIRSAGRAVTATATLNLVLLLAGMVVVVLWFGDGHILVENPVLRVRPLPGTVISTPVQNPTLKVRAAPGTVTSRAVLVPKIRQHSRIDDLLNYPPEECIQGALWYLPVTAGCFFLHRLLLRRTISTFDRCVGRAGAQITQRALSVENPWREEGAPMEFIEVVNHSHE